MIFIDQSHFLHIHYMYVYGIRCYFNWAEGLVLDPTSLHCFYGIGHKFSLIVHTHLNIMWTLLWDLKTLDMYMSVDWSVCSSYTV